MNQEKFELFAAAYRAGLLEAVTAEPEQYAIGVFGTTNPETYAAMVASKSFALLQSGEHMQVNYAGGGFKRACKALKIKPTRKAILAFLGLVHDSKGPCSCDVCHLFRTHGTDHPFQANE